MTCGAHFLFTSPACGGGRPPKAVGRGLILLRAPSPTLPRKRGRETERQSP